MTEEKQFFTPEEAAAFLTEKAGRKITVARLAQLRRDGRIKSAYSRGNQTIYTLKELSEADTELRVPKRKADENQSGNGPLPTAA